MTKVECRCGATELEISANPIVQFFCHCDDCQAVHGGAYAPESVYSADAVKVVRGDPTTWKRAGLANLDKSISGFSA